MPHCWEIVKNSKVGGHRARGEYVAELEAKLTELATREGAGFDFHETVREALGLASGEQVVDLDGSFVGPYPFLHSHGRYLCGLLATPTNVADGLSEFTSLYLLATSSQLLTVILDPPTTYAGPFGQRLLNRHTSHLASGSDDVGRTLLMVIRDNVTSHNFSLRELSHDVEHYEEVLRDFGRSNRSDSFETLEIVESYLLKLRVEVDSLLTVVGQTVLILESIAQHTLQTVGSVAVFDRRHEITAASLAMQAARAAAMRDRLSRDLQALLDKCEQLRNKFFVDATHRFGAVAALLLVPSLIVGIYGQSFEFPTDSWLFSFWFSWTLIVLSTVLLAVYFKRKRWL